MTAEDYGGTSPESLQIVQVKMAVDRLKDDTTAIKAQIIEIGKAITQSAVTEARVNEILKAININSERSEQRWNQLLDTNAERLSEWNDWRTRADARANFTRGVLWVLGLGLPGLMTIVTAITTFELRDAATQRQTILDTMARNKTEREQAIDSIRRELAADKERLDVLDGPPRSVK